MVDSVFDVFEVFMRDWHTDFTEFVNHLVLRVLTSVFKVRILAVEYLAESLFSLFTVDL